MVKIKDPANGIQYNREEAEGEANKLLVDGVQRVSHLKENAPARLVAELCLLTVNQFLEKAKDDTKIGRCFVGILVLVQGLAVVADDEEIDFFIHCIHEYAAKRSFMLEVQEAMENAGPDKTVH